MNNVKVKIYNRPWNMHLKNIQQPVVTIVSKKVCNGIPFIGGVILYKVRGVLYK